MVKSEPSMLAKEVARRIVAEFRPEGWPAKEDEIARLIERNFRGRYPYGHEL